MNKRHSNYISVQLPVNHFEMGTEIKHPHLLVIDARIDNLEQLAQSARPDTQILIVGETEHGFDAITSALATGDKFSSIQIMGHGSAGQLTLGASSFSTSSLDMAQSAQWADSLTSDADILLYGCQTGAGSGGQALISQLARYTQADVAASTNDTGSAALNGDWILEVQTGNIAPQQALDEDKLVDFQGLLANAAPTLNLVTQSANLLLGGSTQFSATFTNPSSQLGFAPFIDLLIPATGYDGDDGIKFDSASYLGLNLISHSVTFDLSGLATHPIAKGSDGLPLVLNAASLGMRPGDQLVTLELPFASFGKDQPAVTADIKVEISNLADTNKPDLQIKVRSGFQYGNDSLNNPISDPSIIEANWDSFSIHPTTLLLTQTLSMPEGETASGPNFNQQLTVTATPAPGQTVHGVQVTQTLPDNIQVTSITPASGGTLSSITLFGGQVLTDAAQINLAINSDKAFIQSYTVRYATLSAAADTVVRFYVPEVDANGNAVLNPISGDDRSILIENAEARGIWLPIDPRDRPPNEPLSSLIVTAESTDTPFVAKSITLLKTCTIAGDNPTTGLSPTDTLQFQLKIAVSDYFSFGENLVRQGQFVVTDQMGDGLSFNGTPTLNFSQDGLDYSITLVYTVGSKTATGTNIHYDIAQSMRDAGFALGALLGDISSDDIQQGASIATISYHATVDEAYLGSHRQSEINEGDSLSNTAEVSAQVLLNKSNMGELETDNSNLTLTVPTHVVDTQVYQINGNPTSATFELHPGDIVTFRMTYDLQTADYEQLKLTAYLPLPIFDVSGSWAEVGGFLPNQWQYAAGDNHPDSVNSVTAIPGNALQFDFGDYVFTGDPSGKNRVDVLFTLKVGDQPFADARSLTVLGQSDQLTTVTQSHLISSDPALIQSLAEPVLAIKHGVVASIGGTVSGTTGSWSAANTAGAAFSGSITDLSAVDGQVVNIDAGDVIRLATAIENTGGGVAFDVSTGITLPAALSFFGGSLAAANLRVSRGDGTLLNAGTDYSVSDNNITFLDNGGVASLLAGRSGTANDNSGANLIVITYDTVAQQSISASQNLQTTATLDRYASIDGGTNFITTPLSDTALQTAAAPVVSKVFAGGTPDDSDSSATHTSGANLVVGESMLYDFVVTLPEGNTQNLRLDDLIPAGLSIDKTFNTVGYQLITTSASSAALTADFNGAVSVQSLTAVTGTLGADGVDARFSFSASSAIGDNIANNNQFVVRVRLNAENVIANQTGAARSNDGQLIYRDPDTDTPNGSSPTDRTIALVGPKPSITVQEPTLQLSQSHTTSGTTQVDVGDDITYTITITNGNAASDHNAFDITFSEQFPTLLGSLSISNVVLSGGATINGGGPAFEITAGGKLQTVAGANVDIPTGGQIVLTVQASVVSLIGGAAGIITTPEVRWTSLDGAFSGERTGADGLLNSGSLNDYRQQDPHTVPISQGIVISHWGGEPSTAAPTPTTDQPQDVAVGEIIRYRVALIVPEGSISDAKVSINLPAGLSFLNDGSAELAFIANQAGISSSNTALTTSGTLSTVGTVTTAGDLLLPNDLSGTTAKINPGAIDTSNPRAVVLQLATIVNADNDLDKEALFFDFNVRVNNSIDINTSKDLLVSASTLSGTTFLEKSADVIAHIVEPKITDLNKEVVAFDPNPDASKGSATLKVSFSNTGDAIAHNIHLTDAMNSGSQYTIQSIQIGGSSYTLATLPAGVTASQGTTGIVLDAATLAIGSQITVTYQVALPNNAAISASNARVEYSSLPDSFATFEGSSVGSAGSVNGERTGTGGINSYFDTDGAGLAYVSGTLWNDTDTPTLSATPDGPVQAYQVVTLTWGGADNNLATTADNQSWSSFTDTLGQYHFGNLGSGVFRVDTPLTINTPQPQGELKPRVDSDANVLGQILFNSNEGSSHVASVGYVEQNDAPVNTLPASATTNEDTPLLLAGISINDVDAGSAIIKTTLTVSHGGLSLPAAGLSSVSGLGTGTLILTGTQTAINTALAALTYSPALNYNGSDTLTVKTEDQGNRGDFDGDGIPNEPVQDQRSDTDTLLITINPINDPPISVADSALAREAGGTANNTAGLNPIGNVLSNDIDVDIATNGDVLRVDTIQFGALTLSVDPGNTFDNITKIDGQYGYLEIIAGGLYRYTVDNSNASVEALRTSSNTLSEVFTYIAKDSSNAASSANLTVTITGANDAPIASNDSAGAVEAGGRNNGTAGSNATGNTLLNDTDIDQGDAKTVTGIRTLRESEFGTLTIVNAGTSNSNGTVLTGKYGSITIGANGTYQYVVDNTNASVQALNVGDTLKEYYSYEVTDIGGLNDIAEIEITINGSNDDPIAIDNTKDGWTAATVGAVVTGVAFNPTGNVILDGEANDTSGDIDSDVDPAIDVLIPATSGHSISAIRTGAESASGTSGSLNTSLSGMYGALVIQSDGSYVYTIDSLNPTLIALGPNATVSDYFTYTLDDGEGGTDTATLTLVIHGVNDQPVAKNTAKAAIEAGGLNNATAGHNPTGDVTANNIDPDGDAINVSAIRTGRETIAGTDTIVGGSTPVVGLYGILTINTDGTFDYQVDNNNVDVQGLRTLANSLQEFFTFTISDDGAPSLSDTGEIRIRVFGKNDNPIAVTDTGTAVEAGGVANGTAGSAAFGNVLTNDTDVDWVSLGETKTVTGVRTGLEGAGPVSGSVGSVLVGSYGSLRLNADGSYTYGLNNNLPAVEALRTGDTLTETFSYQVSDTAGAMDIAELNITIQGSYDTPIAINDQGVASPATNKPLAAVDASGNVLSNDTDVDAGDSKTVTAIRTGLESGTGLAGTVGVVLTGQYGKLTLQANGSYIYHADETIPAVAALTPGQTLIDSFTYQVMDGGALSDLAQLDITINGTNTPPTATPDSLLAVEAGGINNGTAGTNPTGNVISNDSDAEHSALKITAIRTGSVSDSSGTTAGVVGTNLIGRYGSLNIASDGAVTYTVNNQLAVVEKLRTNIDTLQETFTYTVTDFPIPNSEGSSSQATITVTIAGQNDTPLGDDDFNRARPETSQAPALDALGNVLSNDMDIDAGDSKAVTGIRQGLEGAGGALDSVANSGTTRINGAYGWLDIAADGSYVYHADHTIPAVAAMSPLDTLVERFTYQLTDLGGLNDLAQLSILIRGRNDPPVSSDSQLIAREAGGVFNTTLGLDPTGDATLNDFDAEGGALTVTTIRTGAENEGGGSTGTVGTPLQGLYGTLLIQTDGTMQYTVDNSLPVVEALRTIQNELSESFTYTVRDRFGATDQATIRVAVLGQNDNPVGENERDFVYAASNLYAAVDANGNVLDNDHDVDAGDQKTVTGIRRDAEMQGGLLQTLSTAEFTRVNGLYGWLEIAADGSYRYHADENNPAVAKLAGQQSLIDPFTYQLTDLGGLSDLAELDIVIRGQQQQQSQPPLAQDDAVMAREAGGVFNATLGINPSAQVISNDRNPAGGSLSVVAIQSDSRTTGDQTGSVGQLLQGRYGSLLIHSDGQMSYTVDNTLPEVETLQWLHLDTRKDIFTYTVSNSKGETDQAKIVVTIHGQRDNPVAHNDFNAARVDSQFATAIDASGQLLSNDTDVDGYSSLKVSGIRTGVETSTAPLQSVANGAAVRVEGQYGWLDINSNGAYTYHANPAHPEVSALRPTQVLLETFSYQVSDIGQLSDLGELVIAIHATTDTLDAQGLAPAPMIIAGYADSGVLPGTILGQVPSSDDPTPTLQGIASAGALVGVFDGTTLIGSALANSNGVWSFSTSALDNGAHTLLLQAQNAQGILSPIQTIGTLTITHPLTGTASADTLNGSVGNDIFSGLDGNDRLFGYAGNDLILGGNGRDQAHFDGLREQYSFSHFGGELLVNDLRSETTDRLCGIERVQFVDSGIAFDLSGVAGDVARLIGAAYGPANLTKADFVGIGLSLFDGGYSEQQIAQLIVDSTLFKQMSQDGSHQGFVLNVYPNVIGHAPAESELQQIVAQLDQNLTSQRDLLLYAAHLATNEAQIDLLGLSSSGLVYEGYSG